MKVAVDVSPISKSSESAHKVRGVGSYINMLVTNLPKFDKKNEYYFIEDKKFPKDSDIIHYPYFDPFFLTLPLIPDKKFAVTVHDLTPLVFSEHFPAGVKGKLKWQVQKKLLNKASAVIADSNCSRKDIVNIAGIPEDCVKTVYLSAKPNFKRLKTGDWKIKFQKKYGLPETFLLYVGDATWNKNLPRLINAVKNTKHVLVLAGKIWESNASEISDNPWNEDLKLVLSETQAPQFIKPGFVPDDDLVKLYNLATVLIMPSLYEGFGLPVLEAMSSGCPVITTKGGSLGEIGESAVYYVNPEDIGGITEGINNMVEDEKLLSEFSKRGLHQAKKFTSKNSIEQLVKVYESIA